MAKSISSSATVVALFPRLESDMKTFRLTIQFVKQSHSRVSRPGFLQGRGQSRHAEGTDGASCAFQCMGHETKMPRSPRHPHVGGEISKLGGKHAEKFLFQGRIAHGVASKMSHIDDIGENWLSTAVSVVSSARCFYSFCRCRPGHDVVPWLA